LLIRGGTNAEEIKNAAGEKGSRVHHACDDLMQGIEVKIDAKYADKDGDMAELTAEEYWTCMTFRKFLEDEQPEIIGIEYTVLNHEHKYAGTVDISARSKATTTSSSTSSTFLVGFHIGRYLDLMRGVHVRARLDVDDVDELVVVAFDLALDVHRACVFVLVIEDGVLDADDLRLFILKELAKVMQVQYSSAVSSAMSPSLSAYFASIFTSIPCMRSSQA